MQIKKEIIKTDKDSKIRFSLYHANSNLLIVLDLCQLDDNKSC